MKQYIEPEITLIRLTESLMADIISDTVNLGGKDEDEEGGQMAPPNPGWLDESNRFFGRE